MEHRPTFEIPRPRSLVRHALPNVVEATLIPLALFYSSFWVLGVWAAFGAALVWSYGALGWRLVTRRRIPGILALGAVLLTARTVVAVLSGSVFIYFLQPTLGTVLVAGLFLISVPAGRPLAERLARDFLPLPAALMDQPHTRRVFARITLLWAAAHLTNASISLWLLATQPLTTYVVAKQGVSLGVTATAIAASTLLFVLSLRRQGIRVRFATLMP